MRRLLRGFVTALALTLAGRAGAAEITRVATRGEPGNPFQMVVTLRWDRFQERAQITRELASPAAPAPGDPAGGSLGDELRYERIMNVVVPRVAFGLSSDLEAHFEWPYFLNDDRSWRYGSTAVQPTSIDTNGVNADGTPCAVPASPSAPGVCPMFPVAPSTTVYHGGRGGDLKGGLAWGIFNDQKDPTKPSWVVGLDITFPTAPRYDPAGDRDFNSPLWVSPHSDPGKPAPVGEKVWKWDLSTALSKRMGPIDPYFKAHFTLMTKSSATYSNCEHAAQLAGRMGGTGGNAEMNTLSPVNCSAQGASADAKLPWIAGMTFGTEIVAYENGPEQQRVAIDFRLFGDYTSSQRFYNELTDASGKLHWTEEYLTMGGFFGLYLRASKYVSLQATAALSTATSHWLTGETTGQGRAWLPVGANGLTSDPSQMNPNYDARYDAPGRRFRISEVADFAMSFAGVLTF